VPAPEKPATIVVCEGEGRSLDRLCEELLGNGLGVLAAPDATAALRFCRYNDPDLMLLDLALPEGSGVGVLRAIREADSAETRIDASLPVIVLIEREGSAERRLGLNLGAIGCIERPFDFGDLAARVNAAVGRRLSATAKPLTIGELLIDPGRHLVKVGDRSVPLTRKEFALLYVLASEPTRVISRAELLRDVWGEDGSPTRSGIRKLNSHISRLRRKLDPEGTRYVFNCWGIGYRLVGE
jgi:DNA-binding response OmpR family regulator